MRRPTGRRRPYGNHPGLAWLEGSEAGREWLASLERLVGESAEEWGLAVGEPYAYAFSSLALRVTRPGGDPAVLKIQFPDRESQHEAAALARWAGQGAIRLYAHDPDRRALLLERCLPGTALADDCRPDEALPVLASLVRRLAVPAGAPFRSLAEEAGHWAVSLEAHYDAAGRPFERLLLDAALAYLRELPGSQPEQVLLHQDLHAANVLRAEREPWLAIDPKPLVGERAFAVAPIVRGSELGHSEARVRHRLEHLVEALGVERERAVGWTVAQTVAWGLTDDGALPDHVEVARWLLVRR